MADITHFDLGEQWRVTALFKVAGVLTNPGQVSAVLLRPSGALVTIPNGDPRILNNSVGTFTVSDAAAEVGTHYLEVTGTSPAAGTQRFSFVIDPRWPKDLLEPHALTSIERCELILDRIGTQGTISQEEDDKRWLAELINVFSKLTHDYAEREWLPSGQTTANGVNALNSVTMTVFSTVGFPSAGKFQLAAAVALVTYTGKTATSFTGCTAHAATTGGEAIELVEDRVFMYDGDGILVLAPYEARSISAIELYSSLPASLRPFGSSLTEGYVDTGSSWYGEPRNMSESRTWLSVQLPTRRNWLQVTVTGKWGAGVVPSTVRHVVEAEVANSYWASRVRGPAIGPQENYLPQPERKVGDPHFALNPRSEKILDGFRNHPLA